MSDTVDTAEVVDSTKSKAVSILIGIGSSLAVLAVVAVLTIKLTQERDFRWQIHLRYWIVGILVIVFLPFPIARYVFSELTLSLVGALFPVYESVVAVCTPDEVDDTDWLRYWTIGGIFFVATEWFDNAMTSDVADGLKRIFAVGVGTVYPFVSSVGAITTEEFEDDSYWLTYWACYGILFILMDFLETWMGWIPGFYAAIILAEVYLMLPMFGGADKVFRKILVPLFGLKEMLMVRDAFLVKKNLVKDLPPERAAIVRKTIASFFTEDEKDNNSESDLMTAFGFLKPNKNKKPKDEKPTETSSLV
eukprot:scaffold2315_cov113-Cylindrotheca_fusiformis.AAC.3